MSNSKQPVSGTDWTALLADPDLAKNLGNLLRIYREASPDTREKALLDAIRAIKRKETPESVPATVSNHSPKTPFASKPAPVTAIPPFEPDIFSPNWGQDRRVHPRMKCFVAVEMRVNGSDTPIWGYLSNTSLGGCRVETSHLVPGGAKVEIALWVASGKIWVKGLALNGVVSRSAATADVVRIRFAGLDSIEKENLRQFLRYVQEAIKASSGADNYLQLLK